MKPKEILEKAIKKIVGNGVVFIVEHPKEVFHGDFATNVCLVTGPMKGEKNPRDLAKKVVYALKSDKELGKFFDLDEISIAGPGFINFWLKNEWLIDELESVVTMGDDYGRSEWGKGKRVLVEYSSPNIAKQFSIGHLRSTIIGQSLYNLYKFLGWDVVGDNHLGDWGTQFGMIIAIVEEGNLDVSKLSVEDMERLYVEFNTKCKEDPKLKDKAREAFARLEKGEKNARDIWQKAIDISINEFDRIYKMLDIKIDHAYGESYYENVMPEIIEDAKKKKIVRLSDGALIFEYPDLSPAMLLKSNGTTTYFTRDLATIKYRTENKELKSDLYIYEVGAEQTLHFKQVFAAAEMFGWGKKEDFIHIGHGLIMGSDGKKMSTRKGTSLKLEDWLDKMVKLAEKLNKDTSKEVGIGAVKFNDLRHAPVSNYTFSLKEALSLDGASGPYLQYTYARCKSVISKSKTLINSNKDLSTVDINEEEASVLRGIYQFGEVLELAAKTMSPNLICEYIIDLAQRFNTLYSKHRILESKNETLEFRILLTAGVAQLIKNSLKILGISVIEKM